MVSAIWSPPSDHKVLSLIPGFAKIWIFVRPSFPPKLTQLSILLGCVCWELTCNRLMSSLRVKDYHPLNTKETRDKRRFHGLVKYLAQWHFWVFHGGLNFEPGWTMQDRNLCSSVLFISWISWSQGAGNFWHLLCGVCSKLVHKMVNINKNNGQKKASNRT